MPSTQAVETFTTSLYSELFQPRDYRTKPIMDSATTLQP
jgi:hypothetical protein